MGIDEHQSANRFPLPRSAARWRVIGFAVLFMAWPIVCSTSLAGDHSDAGVHESPITDEDRQHWSYQPISRVTPDIASTWRRNAIDDLIFSALSEFKLHPQPEASRRTLIRRLCFDLTGLPPSPAQIDRFEADSAVNAYERLTDRLLDSPRYGERWAQHWLDLARFAETDGFEHDKIRPEAWKYRDWVIGALNEDMPYDKFVSLQIAGDEIAPFDESALTATRFCLSGPDMPDINLIEERRHTLLNELTSTVGEVFLGLQIGCAQCHDHKYDAFSQADFYRLRAVFEPAISLQKNKSVTILKETYPFENSSHVMLRGDFRRPGPEVSPGAIRVVSRSTNTFAPATSARSAGLRTALAQWIVSDENPLTARVIVNRVWQHHFGTGIVKTPSEFGVMGAEPSNYELLDFLAAYLIDNEWSLKQLHRLIVSSATYRQQSSLSPDANEAGRNAWRESLRRDPDASLLSRYPRWRLEGEAIRDSMLVAAERLNLKSGGPGVRPPLPKELVGTLLRNQWDGTKDESEHTRRSIYVFARRNLRYPIFDVFDRPSANASCCDRGVSTTAPQSLHLLNSSFSLGAARHLAAFLQENIDNESERINSAFLRTLGRTPSPDEIKDVQRFLDDQKELSSDESDALTHLCLSLFNCNEFVFVE